MAGDVIIGQDGRERKITSISQRYETGFAVSNLTIGIVSQLCSWHCLIFLHNDPIFSEGEAWLKQLITSGQHSADEVAHFVKHFGFTNGDEVLKRIAPTSLVPHIPSFGRKFNQISRRGWTRTTINETVNNPFVTRAAINKANKNPATAFFNSDGSHVICDNITGELIQLSDRLNPGTWIPDPSILNPFKP